MFRFILTDNEVFFSDIHDVVFLRYNIFLRNTNSLHDCSLLYCWCLSTGARIDAAATAAVQYVALLAVKSMHCLIPAVVVAR